MEESNLLAEERQDKIQALLREKGAVSTASLIDTFNVSIETIRRDLIAMEKEGKLSRVHGGAVVNSAMKPFTELKERNKEHSEQKRRLSEKAMEFISEGDIIGIDAGSTAIFFTQVLKEHFRSLTVVTNSYDVFDLLRNHSGFSVFLSGGYYFARENSFCGELALSTLKSIHMQKAFVFPSAISYQYGICDYENNTIQMQKQFIKSSDKIYILADSSKFEKKSLLKMADMSREFDYITDDGLSEELRNLYAENDINVYIG